MIAGSARNANVVRILRAIAYGLRIARSRRVGFKRLDDCVAYQFAVEFKTEVYALIKRSREASGDFRFRAQLSDAASGVSGSQAEAFYRYRPAEIANFLTYALASLGEAEDRLKDGILRGYFPSPECVKAFIWARRCRSATKGWLASQLKLLDRQEKERQKRSGTRRAPRPPRWKANRKRDRDDEA
jgi:four helix bundle protein